MLYLKRKIDAFLSEWKANPDKKPLIVKGPRQVGKTESIQRFAAENYTSVITINFVEEPKYKMITADGYKAADIIKNISRIDPSKRFIEGETLIFFDELQEFPDIATVSATRPITRCSRWILRNFCGPAATTTPLSTIC